MSSTIQIKFLTLDEMANAKDIDYRYEHVGIDNLGFADKAKNRVFVRAGLEPQLQTLLIDHELSHLFEMEGTDEDEFGIRHKKKGGFMKIFAPIALAILGSIIMPGIGTYLGGSLGGLLGGPVGVGLGSMLGGVSGSSATGKPNWLGNTIGGAAAGIGSGLGSALGGLGGSGLPSGATITSGIGGVEAGLPAFTGATGAATGSGIGSGLGQSIGSLAGGSLGGLFSGALGQGQSAQGGSRPGSTSSSFKMPDMSQQANSNPGFSGWSENAYVPDMAPTYGASGVESQTNSRGMGGQALMPTQPGLGQGGISLSGKDYSGGFGNKQMAGGMDQMFNPADPFGANMSF